MRNSIKAFLLLVSIITFMPAQLSAGTPQLYQERLEVGRALLEVEVVSAGEPGRPGPGDDLALFHLVANCDLERRAVPVQ